MNLIGKFHHTNAARFAAAQAESGRHWNIRIKVNLNQSQQNVVSDLAGPPVQYVACVVYSLRKKLNLP